MELLSDAQIAEALVRFPDWKVDGKQIVRRYSFNTFLQGIHFVNQVANFAESQNHHPFISIDFKHVTLRLTSWHAGGLTSLDTEFAFQADTFYKEDLLT